MRLRPYQEQLKSDIYAAWQAGHQNVLAVMPTGAGKSLTVADIMRENAGAGIAIAHRAEIIVQLSLAFARQQIRHRIIGPQTLSRTCAAVHVAELDRSYISPQARVAVSSAQTLVRYKPESWMLEVTMLACDESHHLLATNLWGKVLKLFPNARGLLPTATPIRADGCGLGRHADGLADIMVQGPTMRQLINDGWLSDYRIFAPPSDISLAAVPISAGGDYSPQKLAEAVHASHIVGDIVQQYQRIASGKLGITFCVDVDACVETAQAYRSAGIAAEVISGETPPLLRAELMRRFRNRQILQLVNCDVLAEGVDVPAVEVVSMARPTTSLSLHIQQVGRALRPSPGKTHGIIIDHASNTLRLGLPDAPRTWTLDPRDKRTRGTPDDVIPVRTCLNPSHPVRGGMCLFTYERVHKACPDCGFVPVPQDRSSIECVDGELMELDAATLARLRGEIDKPLVVPYGATPAIQGAVKKHHRERCEAQESLRSRMALWGGWRTMLGEDEGMQQRRWWHTFGIDVLSAMALNKNDAGELEAKVRKVLEDAGVVIPLDEIGNIK